MNNIKSLFVITLLTITLLILAPSAKADAVTEWNIRACDITGPPAFDTPSANRAVATMHTAIYEAVNAITKRYPSGDLKINPPSGASVDAAVASAARTALPSLKPIGHTRFRAFMFRPLSQSLPCGPRENRGS
jgi:hypothetical protein